ncbi:MAG TPA: amidase [Gemmatimonadaceae bacterium]
MTDRRDAGADREGLSRRSFVGTGLLGGAAALAGAALPWLPGTAAAESDVPARPAPAARPAPFELEEATIAALQEGMQSGKYTARSLAEMYLARIEELDQQGPAINQVLEVNPDALAIADRLDAERKAKGARGPLHGIPVLLKDNLATADRMSTTAGSLALAGSIAPHDSFVARKLREAGAVLLGKTNLSEWANFRSTHSCSGWSGRGGQTHNPYALDRTPSGSSSGSAGAIAANYAAVAIGTETDGSIVSPSAACSVVGIKPTLGLVSRAGVVPIAHSQDTAGPIARTVRDAAILLGAIAGVDPDDAATAAGRGKGRADYTTFLDPNGLKGARIGVARERYMGYSRASDALVEDAIRVMKDRGATIVDPANIPTAGKWDDSEFDVLLYEFKADLNKYLAWLGPSAPVKSLADVIRFNDEHAAREMPFFGQEIMHMAEKKGALTDPAYRKALAKNHRLTRAEGIDAVMDRHRLDALIAPTQGPAWLIDLVNGDAASGGSSSPAAVAGYPSITVPAGYDFGLPVGLSFIGRAWSEPTLIRLAYAYEQATTHRRPPAFALHAAVPANGRPAA